MGKNIFRDNVVLEICSLEKCTNRRLYPLVNMRETEYKAGHEGLTCDVTVIEVSCRRRKPVDITAERL